MSHRSYFYACLFLMSTSMVQGASQEVLNAENPQFEFEISRSNCASLQDLLSQRVALTEQLSTMAADGVALLQSVPQPANEALLEAFQQKQKASASIVTAVSALNQKIQQESNTRGGLLRVSYPSTQKIPQNSKIFYTNLSSYPELSLEDLPSYLGYQAEIRNQQVLVTSILSKGYACLLLTNPHVSHSYPHQLTILRQAESFSRP